MRMKVKAFYHAKHTRKRAFTVCTWFVKNNISDKSVKLKEIKTCFTSNDYTSDLLGKSVYNSMLIIFLCSLALNVN